MSTLSKSSIDIIKCGTAQNWDEDLRIEFHDGENQILAGASIWYRQTPEYKGSKVAFLGRFKTRSRALSVELMHLAEAEIEKLDPAYKIKYLIGPVDGNTWNSYRLVTDGFDSPPFALENFTAKDLPGHFLAAGFESIASYQSSILPPSTSFSRGKNRLQEENISIRNFRLEDADKELENLYKISIEAFQKNFLYSPISPGQFKQLYSPVLKRIDPEFVFIAESEGRPIAYLFAIDDRAAGGKRDKCLVIKTLARLPDRAFDGLGIGRHLVGLCHERARERGYQSIIHALYKSDNRSESFSTLSGARQLRRYELYGKEIGRDAGVGK